MSKKGTDSDCGEGTSKDKELYVQPKRKRSYAQDEDVVEVETTIKRIMRQRDDDSRQIFGFSPSATLDRDTIANKFHKLIRSVHSDVNDDDNNDEATKILLRAKTRLLEELQEERKDYSVEEPSEDDSDSAIDEPVISSEFETQVDFETSEPVALFVNDHLARAYPNKFKAEIMPNGIKFRGTARVVGDAMTIALEYRDTIKARLEKPRIWPLSEDQICFLNRTLIAEVFSETSTVVELTAKEVRLYALNPETLRRAVTKISNYLAECETFEMKLPTAYFDFFASLAGGYGKCEVLVEPKVIRAYGHGPSVNAIAKYCQALRNGVVVALTSGVENALKDGIVTEDEEKLEHLRKIVQRYDSLKENLTPFNSNERLVQLVKDDLSAKGEGLKDPSIIQMELDIIRPATAKIMVSPTIVPFLAGKNGRTFEEYRDNFGVRVTSTKTVLDIVGPSASVKEVKTRILAANENIMKNLVSCDIIVTMKQLEKLKEIDVIDDIFNKYGILVEPRERICAFHYERGNDNVKLMPQIIAELV